MTGQEAREHEAFNSFIEYIEESEEFTCNHPDENEEVDWLPDFEVFVAGWDANSRKGDLDEEE